MTALASSGMEDWKLIALVAMTLIAIASAHVHSARSAIAHLRARPPLPRWRGVLSYLARHELHYAKQVPLLVFFVICSVGVMASI